MFRWLNVLSLTQRDGLAGMPSYMGQQPSAVGEYGNRVSRMSAFRLV